MTATASPAGSLTVGPLRPAILRLAAPAVAMMAFNVCFTIIDSIWVGRLIGPAALAAVSTAGSASLPWPRAVTANATPNAQPGLRGGRSP